MPMQTTSNAAASATTSNDVESESAAQVERRLSALESLPTELLLTIVEQLKYKTLRRLQRVSKRMQAVVATRTPTLDKRLWRVNYSLGRLRKAHEVAQRNETSPLQLHPILQKLSLKIFLDSPIQGPGVLTRSKYLKIADLGEAKHSNATYPPIKMVMIESFVPHDQCPKAQEQLYASDDSCDSAGEPEFLCTPPVYAESHDGGPMSVAELAGFFKVSLSGICQEYGGDFDYEISFVFKGWDRRTVSPETGLARFGEPIWEHEEDDA